MEKKRYLQNIHRRKNKCMTRYFILEHHYITNKFDLSVDPFITSLDAKFVFYIYDECIDIWKQSIKTNIFTHIDEDDIIFKNDNVLSKITDKHILYFGKLVYIDDDDNIKDVKQNISGIIFGRNIFRYVHNGDDGGFILKVFKHKHLWR